MCIATGRTAARRCRHSSDRCLASTLRACSATATADCRPTATRRIACDRWRSRTDGISRTNRATTSSISTIRPIDGTQLLPNPDLYGPPREHPQQRVRTADSTFDPNLRRLADPITPWPARSARLPRRRDCGRLPERHRGVQRPAARDRRPGFRSMAIAGR